MALALYECVYTARLGVLFVWDTDVLLWSIRMWRKSASENVRMNYEWSTYLICTIAIGTEESSTSGVLGGWARKRCEEHIIRFKMYKWLWMVFSPTRYSAHPSGRLGLLAPRVLPALPTVGNSEQWFISYVHVSATWKTLSSRCGVYGTVDALHVVGQARP